MKLAKLTLFTSLLCLLSACGVGEFFIKRAVNGFEKDVASEFNDYADFNESQKQQIDVIASEIDAWLRTDRLPAVTENLSLVANDIEANSRIQEETWNSVVAFLERPINMSEKTGLIERMAMLAQSLSDEQARDAITKLDKDYAKALAEQEKRSFEKQNKRITKFFKRVFSELDISRSQEQLKQAREALGQRRYHEQENNLQRQQNQQAFKALIENRTAPQDQYVAEFLAAWRTAEAGAKYRAPEKWNHNARVTLDVVNNLLVDLDQQQRFNAASKIRAYAEVFTELNGT